MPGRKGGATTLHTTSKQTKRDDPLTELPGMLFSTQVQHAGFGIAQQAKQENKNCCETKYELKPNGTLI